MAFHCVQHPEKRGFLLLHFDDEPLAELSTAIYGKNPPLPKMNSSKEELFDALKEIEVKGAKRLLLNKLAIKSYHSIELRELLAKNEVSQETSDKAIDECMRLGYLNDEEWVDHFVTSERRKKRGPDWIEAKLRQKKIPQREIDGAMEKIDDDEEMRDQICRLIRTRYRARNLLDFREREKTIGALIRRGFDVNMVREVIRQCSQSE